MTDDEIDRALVERTRADLLDLLSRPYRGPEPDRARMAEQVRDEFLMPFAMDERPIEDPDELASATVILAVLREVVDEVGRSVKARASTEVVEAAAAIVEGWMETRH